MGAAMLAAYGCGWFPSLQECAAAFLRPAQSYKPNPETVERYNKLFAMYQKVYHSTRELSSQLMEFRD